MVHSGTCRLPNAKADRRRQIGPARIHKVKDGFEHQDRTTVFLLFFRKKRWL